MAKAGTHYERAFEDMLHRRKIRYVAVDQAKKAVFAGVRIKSFDFLVYPAQGTKILVDVKGRKFSSTAYQKGRWGETWVTSVDVEGLNCWEEVFGAGYKAAFVFAYWLTDCHEGDLELESSFFDDIYRYEGRDYAFAVVEVDTYQRWMRTRSASWKTVFVSQRQFRRMAQPFDEYIRC
ncbi:MAG: HYExAFE family protein [Planctomycetes bacterium]|nr:HYExAFE family protein [Planctomycetota bacterium]